MRSLHLSVSLVRPKWLFGCCLAVALFALAFGVATPSQGHAATCGDVTMPDTITHGGTSLTLNGMGIRKATLLAVHVYVAGLYLPAKSNQAEAIIKADKPWSIQMHFVHSVDRDDIQDAWSEGFEKNIKHETAGMKDRIVKFNKMMPDLKSGDVLAFSYDGTGKTTVHLNGKSAGVIDGPDFSSALKAIWLGRSPPNSVLKSGLLGGACE